MHWAQWVYLGFIVFMVPAWVVIVYLVITPRPYNSTGK